MNITHIRYPGQLEEEITQRVVYKHIISILPFLFSVLVFAIAIPVLAFFLLTNNIIPSWTISIIGIIYIALLAVLFISVIWIWRNNMVILTTEHIVDVDQMGLFNKKVSTLRHDEIQDVSAKVSGPLQTILQYGTIEVQTAGERSNFLFDYVKNPYELEHYILEVRKASHDNQSDNVHHNHHNGHTSEHNPVSSNSQHHKSQASENPLEKM